VYDELFNVFQTTVMIDCAISIVVSSILDCAKRENNIHAWEKEFSTVSEYICIYPHISYEKQSTRRTKLPNNVSRQRTEPLVSVCKYRQLCTMRDWE